MTMHDNQRTKRSNRNTRTLGLEQLESRLMNTISDIEQGLFSLSQSADLGSTQIVTNSLRNTNAAPRVASQPSQVTRGEVRTTSTQLSVLGADDQGERALRYTWSVVRQPTGANVAFSSNNSNAAKNVTATFNRAGDYTFQVRITDALGASTTATMQVRVLQTLQRISVTSSDNRSLSNNGSFNVAGPSASFSAAALDQFGTALTTQPNFTFSLTRPAGSSATSTVSRNTTTVNFDRAGTYALTVRSGAVSFTSNLTATSNAANLVVTSANQLVRANNPISETSTSRSFQVLTNDQFNQQLRSQPSHSWTMVSGPTGATPRFTINGSSTNVLFNRAGTYTLRVQAGALSQNITVNVVPTVAQLTPTSSVSSINVNQTAQFQVTGRDQFQQPISLQNVTWSTTLGSISSTGLLTAGSTGGQATITVSSGSVRATTTLAIVAPTVTDNNSVTTPALRSLLQTIYVDNSISRTEMIQLLRSVGNDGIVTGTELTDLRYIVSANSTYRMADYVRELAKDVVNPNPANARFKGQTAGNLAAGSSSTLLNNLVDKWFLGADEPIIVGGSISYRVSNGNLFNGNPSRNDARQGALGDCYFIAAVAAIADKTPDAIRNMFIDNGDGTYTVRFYAGALGMFYSGSSIVGGFLSGSGVADYVTVNRQLPTYSNGTLAYSGAGSLASNPATTLWLPLLEKAYAQWNETGNAGRNGTNSYAGIEGGWMHNVNAPVLGFNSTNFLMSSAQKQSLVDAINSGKAVTIGTNSGANAGGLVGSHAYIVTGYNSVTDTFTLFNPWAFAHPTPLTWSQLQSNCSMFIVTGTSGTSPISNTPVLANTTLRSDVPILISLEWTHQSSTQAIVTPMTVISSDTPESEPTFFAEEQHSASDLTSNDALEIESDTSNDQDEDRAKLFGCVSLLDETCEAFSLEELINALV